MEILDRRKLVLEELDGIINDLDDVKFKQNMFGSEYILEENKNKLIYKLHKSAQYIRENFDYREFLEVLEDEGFYLENEDVVRELIDKDEFQSYDA